MKPHISKLKVVLVRNMDYTPTMAMITSDL